MNFFNFSISGTDTIDVEINESFAEINNAVPLALATVETQMRESLEKHIRQDVYAKYKPSAYPRRVDNPQFGQSLIDSITSPVIKGNILVFDYNPTGEHSGTLADTLNWSSFSKTMSDKAAEKQGQIPIKPHPVHGDMLIQRLQTGKGYDWESSKIPPRPFWNNFIDEQQNSGLINSFIAGMRNKGITVVAQGNDIELDGNEKL